MSPRQQLTELRDWIVAQRKRLDRTDMMQRVEEVGYEACQFKVAAILAALPVEAAPAKPSTLSGLCGCDGPTRIDPACKWHSGQPTAGEPRALPVEAEPSKSLDVRLVPGVDMDIDGQPWTLEAALKMRVQDLEAELKAAKALPVEAPTTPDPRAELQALQEAMSSLIDRWGQRILRLEEEQAQPVEAPTTCAWQPIATAPIGIKSAFWIVPKTADETYTDARGRPITADHEPYCSVCHFGAWPALSKATHWKPAHDYGRPAPPTEDH